MNRKRRLILCGALLLGGCGAKDERPESPDDLRNRILSEYVPSFTVTTDPAVVRSGQPVTFTVKFTASQSCNEPSLALRMYDADSYPDPGFTDVALAGSDLPYDAASAVGSKLDITFDPITMPAPVVQHLTSVLWLRCTVRIPREINQQTGMIIWQVEEFGIRLGSASFVFDCPVTPGDRSALCAYRHA